MRTRPTTNKRNREQALRDHHLEKAERKKQRRESTDGDSPEAAPDGASLQLVAIPLEQLALVRSREMAAVEPSIKLVNPSQPVAVVAPNSTLDPIVAATPAVSVDFSAVPKFTALSDVAVTNGVPALSPVVAAPIAAVTPAVIPAGTPAVAVVKPATVAAPIEVASAPVAVPQVPAVNGVPALSPVVLVAAVAAAPVAAAVPALSAVAIAPIAALAPVANSEPTDASSGESAPNSTARAESTPVVASVSESTPDSPALDESATKSAATDDPAALPDTVAPPSKRAAGRSRSAAGRDADNAAARQRAELDGAPAKPETAAARQSQTLLIAGVEAVSGAWVDELRTSLRRERRPISGGWPGTLSEARHRVAVCLLPWLQQRGGTVHYDQSPPSEVARQLNSAARRAWLMQSEADHEPWDAATDSLSDRA